MSSVSVVIAARDAGPWIGETIESVLAQTRPAMEVIVVDDGSTDDTAAIAARYGDPVRVLRRPPGGLAAARNAGVAASEGDLIALLDADDLWRPTKLAEQVALADRHPEAGLIACDVELFDETGTTMRGLFTAPMRRELASSRDGSVTRDRHADFIRRNLIAAPAQTLMPRWALDAIGPFADSHAQDYDCYLRLAQRFAVTLHAPLLARWRQHAGSMSGAAETRAFRWELATLAVLDTHRGRTRGLDRARVRWAIERRQARIAAIAVRHGLREDRRAAQEFLDELISVRRPPAARVARAVLSRWPARSPGDR